MVPVEKEPANIKKENETMLYMMICKQHRQEEKRFWFCQEREFVMPVSEKQIWTVTGVFRKDK